MEDIIASLGVKAVILGCTELPLMITEEKIGDV